MTRKLIKNAFKCLYCNDIIESKHRHDFSTCKCGKTSIDGGTSYIRLVGDLDMIQNMIEYVEVWEDGDKIRCIDDSEQNTLKLNSIIFTAVSVIRSYAIRRFFNYKEE